MTRAGIHDRGGPRKLTAPQRARAEQLVDQGIYVYPEKHQGKGIIAAFRRYLETGDAGKITNPLYNFLTLKCDFIAHYSLGGFRSTYADAADLLESKYEMYGLRPPVTHSQSVYTDGMTSLDVWEGIRGLTEELGPSVRARSAEQRRELEIATAAALAERHGLKLTPTGGDGA